MRLMLESPISAQRDKNQLYPGQTTRIVMCYSWVETIGDAVMMSGGSIEIENLVNAINHKLNARRPAFFTRSRERSANGSPE